MSEPFLDSEFQEYTDNRIDELKAQLAEANARADTNLRELNRIGPLLTDAMRRAAWTRIDAEHLPKVGDEVGIWRRTTKGVWNSHFPRKMVWEIRKVWMRDHETYEQWIKVATHYRPINAPGEEKK